ncbi:MAG: hypothetical protein ACKVT1_06065 [Dehalococcoidia bacterium]
MAQHAVELILLKQWASYLTMPIFVIDASGDLIYYNEPAEGLLGRRFDDHGELSVADMADIFVTTALDGSPIAADELPIGIALLQRRPAHGRLRFVAYDGVARTIDVTAFPVEGQGTRFLGAVAMFWETGTWK